jgi:hypothetical protein
MSHIGGGVFARASAAALLSAARSLPRSGCWRAFRRCAAPRDTGSSSVCRTERPAGGHLAVTVLRSSRPDEETPGGVYHEMRTLTFARSLLLSIDVGGSTYNTQTPGCVMPSLAQRQFEIFETDRRAHLQQILDKATPSVAAKLQAIKADSEISGYPAIRYMENVARSVTEGMNSVLGESRRDVDDIVFGLVDEDDVLATMSPFQDGSSLVLVSDALPSLLFHLACLNIAVRRPRSRKALPEATACAVLRFHVIQQRIYSLAGKCAVILDDDELKEAHNLSTAALHFAVAHETAHHVLGHSPKPGRSITSARLAIADDSESTEIAADSLAQKVQLTRISKNRGGFSPWLALAPSLLVLLAIELVERSFFIRTAKTHPPSWRRWQALSIDFPDSTIRQVQS